MFQVDEQKRAKYEQGLKDGLPIREAAKAAGYSDVWARQRVAETKGPLTEKELIDFAWEQIHDSKCPERVRQRYWEKLGEYYRLWGPRAERHKPQEPVDFPIEGDETQGATPPADQARGTRGNNGGSPKG